MAEKIQHTSGSVESYFRLNFLLGETLNAGLYNAIDLRSGKSANIWISKDRVDLSSDIAHQLLDHLHKFDGINPPLADFDYYGCDSEGKMFLVFAHNFNINLLLPRGNFDEMIRRLYRFVRIIAKLHQEGLSIGTLSDKSFYLTKSGTVEFSSGLKAFSHDGGKLMEGLTTADLVYVAPELVDNTFSKRSDVYSLGVLGFKAIFDQEHLTPVYQDGSLFVSSDISKLTITSDLNNLVRVLNKATEPNPENRYASAEEFMEALVLSLNKQAGKLTESTIDNEQVSVLPALQLNQKEISKSEQQKVNKQERISKAIAWSIAGVFLLSAIVGILVYRKYQTRLAQEIEAATAPFSGGNPELTKSVAKIANLSTELKEKIKEIQQLGQ